MGSQKDGEFYKSSYILLSRVRTVHTYFIGSSPQGFSESILQMILKNTVTQRKLKTRKIMNLFSSKRRPEMVHA